MREREGEKDVLLDRGQALFYRWKGGAQVPSAWRPYFPHDIGSISAGEPHGGPVKEKLGHYYTEMSMQCTPEGRHTVSPNWKNNGHPAEGVCVYM